MKKRIAQGLALGIVAGIIDVIPMVLQRLTWDANCSAFSLWVVSGVLVATVPWRINHIIKGILIPMMVLLPTAIIIGWKKPISLVPIGIMTLILGSLLGLATGQLDRADQDR